jgi:hypothetical protein
MTCDLFNTLLTDPDKFRKSFAEPRKGPMEATEEDQITMAFLSDVELIDPAYDDLEEYHDGNAQVAPDNRLSESAENEETDDPRDKKT